VEALTRRVDELQESVERTQDQNRASRQIDGTQLEIQVTRLDLDDRDGRSRGC